LGDIQGNKISSETEHLLGHPSCTTENFGSAEWRATEPFRLEY